MSQKQGVKTGLDIRESLGQFIKRKRRQLEYPVFLENHRKKLELSPQWFQRTGKDFPSAEEIALAVPITLSWYKKIEQGSAQGISRETLRLLADALLLNDADRAMLFTLAGQPFQPKLVDLEVVGPSLAALVDNILYPAMILGHRWDVLAENRISIEVFTDDYATPGGKTRNSLRTLLMSKGLRSRLVDPERHLRSMVQLFQGDYLQRLAQGSDESRRFSDDPAESQRISLQLYEEIIDEMLECSEEFRRWWKVGATVIQTHMIKTVKHPVVGKLYLAQTVFTLYENPDMVLCVYMPDQSTDTAEKLGVLRQLKGL